MGSPPLIQKMQDSDVSCMSSSSTTLTRCPSNVSLATLVDSEGSSIADDSLHDDAREVMLVKTIEESLSKRELCRSCELSLTRSVHFGSIEIHFHSMTLGCHPGVSSGPPLTIGWETLSSTIMSIDEYEASRPPRKSAFNLKLTSSEREQLLLSQGVSVEDMRRAQEYVESIQQSRAESAADKSELQAMLHEARRKKSAKPKRAGLFSRFRKGARNVAVAA